jgi:ribosome-binding factor A
MNRRLQRVNELVKRAVGEIIRRDFVVSEFGVVTVTSVEISPDLKNGRIFISVIGTPQQQALTLRTLGARRGAIQQEMSRSVILKYTPHLEFLLDETGARADRINRILEDLHLPEDNSA